VGALHDEFEFVELCLGVEMVTLSSLFLFLRVSFWSLMLSETRVS